MKTETLNQLQDWTRRFANTEAGAWLYDFDWETIPVDWSDKCNADNGIMGFYAFGRIGLMDCELVPQYIWPTYVHELYHRWQWTTSPFRYLAGKVFRPLIENPADRITEAAEKWIEENAATRKEKNGQKEEKE